MADSLGNFGEFSVLTYFCPFGISRLFERMLWTGRFSFKPVGGGGGGTILNQYDFNVHTHTAQGVGIAQWSEHQTRD